MPDDQENAPIQEARREALQPHNGRQRYFITGFTGTIEVPALGPDDAQHILARLRAGLVAQKAGNLRLAGSRLTFDVDWLRLVTNRNLLAFVDGGEFTVLAGAPGSLKYRFSFRRSLVEVTVLVALFSLFFLPQLLRGPIFMLGFPVALWFFLFVFNYLIAAARLQDFVRRAVSG